MKYLTPFIFFVLCVVFLSGCRVVTVKDSHGRPVSGVWVTPCSPNLKYRPVVTKKDGTAVLDVWYAQTPKWLELYKAEYRYCRVDFPKSFPCEIRMRRKVETERNDESSGDSGR